MRHNKSHILTDVRTYRRSAMDPDLRQGVAVMVLLMTLSACTQSFPGKPDEKRTSAYLCNHFAGEEPYDADRAAFLGKQTALYCQ